MAKIAIKPTYLSPLLIKFIKTLKMEITLTILTAISFLVANKMIVLIHQALKALPQ
jgi:hypothetical protein